MMELILWRHADAEEGSPDLQRRLTAKGEKQARRMAEWLHAHLPQSTKVLVSPATRAQQTAQAFADVSHRKFKTIDAIAPGAGADAVLTAAGWPNAKAPVLIVGHQPTLGMVAANLLMQGDSSIAIKKAAIWWFSSRTRDGEEQAVLRAVVNSDLL